jgi:endonuclease YncB( thermonuclease family)
MKSLRPYLLALCLLLPPVLAGAETIQGRVVGVTDGDTIRILDGNNQQHKIRLGGIDAPEKNQPYGTKSKSNLSSLVFNKQVTLECGKTDKYGRLVCVVMLEGQDINLKQVKSGFAWHYRKYASEQTTKQRQDYEAAEGLAREQRAGLWADQGSVPPWQWRKR